MPRKYIKKDTDKETKRALAKRKKELVPVQVSDEHAQWLEENKNKLAENIRLMYRSWQDKGTQTRLMERADSLVKRTGVDVAPESKRNDTYCPAVGEQIAAMIAVGGTLRDVERLTGLCVWQLTKWKLEHPDFRRLMEMAKKLSAESLVEEAVDSVRMAQNMFQLKKGDTLQKVLTWLAQRRDPEQFGAVEKHEVKSVNVILDYDYK